MEFFRKLAGNIFFKIILGFVALSFVLFGVSEFILGSPNVWVAKVGSTTIGYNTFNKALQSDREMILSNNKTEEVLKFLESDQFKSEVLGRLVNKIMIEKLHAKLGVEASRKLIMQTIAKNKSFKNPEGKFDRELFKKFLSQNGLTEQKYVDEIANEVVATMIIQTLAMTSPFNEQAIIELENFKQEKRFADVITINEKNLKALGAPNNEEIEKYFSSNKDKYAAPETRLVSYVHFSKKDFANEYKISKSDILAEYEASKEQLTKPETRAFYHVLFEKEESAQEFLTKLAGSSGDAKSNFAKLAKELAKKDLKAISLPNISQKDLLPELSDKVFKLEMSKTSEVLKSPLGFHVFLLTEIKKPQLIPLAEVEKSLEIKIAKNKEEKLLQSKISAIDDALLTSNSLEEVTKKFGLKINKNVRIDAKGLSEKGVEVLETKNLADFALNSFALKKGQVSKIFYTKNSDGFYAIKLEEITPSHERKLEEVRGKVVADLSKEKKDQGLKNFAKEVAKEVKENPTQIAQIAAKHQLKLEKNREFPRSYFIDSGNGRQIPYQNGFLTELFNIKINEATSLTAAGENEFKIGTLRQIKSSASSEQQVHAAKEHAIENFKTEILQEYNALLLKENPVKVNEKFFGVKEEKE